MRYDNKWAKWLRSSDFIKHAAAHYDERPLFGFSRFFCRLYFLSK
uniref:Uncharacterized protein n=1 Tax=Candidatus Giovannonibacteria bacterium GW2011_GWF2_42_19 TaxID=1618659 RepID=A0A0G0ZHL2_9BACT|nr:MAG: hypothetical protein UV11_C0011G0025 [Candidatus Giovannonibacteria bacterium GW2011_GWF2_42_19]